MNQNKKNTYGRSINIKHMLNTRLKSKPYNFQGKILESYPIYLRVSVKRQSTMLRSYISDYIPVELFDEYLKKFASDFEIETNEIKRRIEKDNPFENDDFILHYSLVEINPKKFDLADTIKFALSSQMTNVLLLDIRSKFCSEKELLFSNYGTLVNNHTKDSNVIVPISEEVINDAALELTISIGLSFNHLPLKLFSIYASKEFPNFLEVWNSYDISIWRIEEICDIIKKETGHRLAVEDIYSDCFDELYLRVFHQSNELAGIHTSIGKLSSSCRALADTVDL